MFFLMIRAFERCQLECHRTAEKFLMAGNQTIFDFLKMIHAELQNPLKIQLKRNSDVLIQVNTAQRDCLITHVCVVLQYTSVRIFNIKKVCDS